MEIDINKVLFVLLGIFLVAGLLTAGATDKDNGIGKDLNKSDKANIDKIKASVDKGKEFVKITAEKYKEVKDEWGKLKLKHNLLKTIFDTNEGKTATINFVTGIANKMIDRIDTLKEKEYFKKNAKYPEYLDLFENAKTKINAVIESLNTEMTLQEIKAKINELKTIWKELQIKNRLIIVEKFSDKSSIIIEKMDKILNQLDTRIGMWKDANVDTSAVEEKYNIAVENVADAKTKLNTLGETLNEFWASDMSSKELVTINKAAKEVNIAIHKATNAIKQTIKEEKKLNLPGEKDDDETKSEKNKSKTEDINNSSE